MITLYYQWWGKEQVIFEIIFIFQNILQGNGTKTETMLQLLCKWKTFLFCTLMLPVIQNVSVYNCKKTCTNSFSCVSSVSPPPHHPRPFIFPLKIFSILSAAGVETEEWGVDGGPSFLHLWASGSVISDQGEPLCAVECLGRRGPPWGHCNRSIPGGHCMTLHLSPRCEASLFTCEAWMLGL